jgi:hypothetical protein
MTKSSHRILLRRIHGAAKKLALDSSTGNYEILLGMLMAYELSGHSTPSQRARALHRIFSELIRDNPTLALSLEETLEDWAELVQPYEAAHHSGETNALKAELEKAGPLRKEKP